MRRPLTLAELIAVLDGWNGCAVAVRIVTRPDDLVAVFEGRLGRRTDAKHASTWWPLESSRDTAGLSSPGSTSTATSSRTRPSARAVGSCSGARPTPW